MRGFRPFLLSSFFLCSAQGFDQDGRSDIAWHHRLTGENLVWSLGAQLQPAATNALPTASGTNWQMVTTVDLNRDGHPDLLWRDPTTGQNAVWFLNATNMLLNPGPAQITPGDTNFFIVGTGDFSGDGYSDIVWRHKTQNRTAVWFMGPPHGTNLTGVGFLPGPPELEYQPAAIGDFNYDNDPDVVWRHRGNGRNLLWLMDGLRLQNQISDPLFPKVEDLGWQLVGTGHFNPLGQTDIVWRHLNGNNAVWLMRGIQFLGGPSLKAVPDPNWTMGGFGGYTNTLLLAANPVAPRLRITLDWRFGPANIQTIERKTPSSSVWTNLINTTNYLPRQFTSSDVVVGQRYEYRVAGDYLLTAAQGTPQEHRGTVLLIVENSIRNGLEPELNRLKTNLVGDGWTVLRTNVNRHNDNNWPQNLANIASVKAFITNAYRADPSNTKAVFLIGHVPVPYSGVLNPDGHFYRALPADGYYGDVDGLYTDSTNYFTSGNVEARHNNVNGDGKFDQNRFPSKLELAVGRVDFANMSEFAPKTEIDLLRQYFKKNDRFRRKFLPYPDQIMVGSFFQIGGPVPLPLVKGLYNAALKNGSRLFGLTPGYVTEGDPLLPQSSALWGIHGGFGGPANVRGTNGTQHLSKDFSRPPTEPRVAFLSLFGSYLMDWDHPNNLLRAFIAMENHGLGSMWFQANGAGNATDVTPLSFEGLALGETVGSAMLRTINETPQGVPSYTSLSWMGDPTLRWQILEPPTGLTSNDGTNVMLSWNTATQPGVAYHVYRAHQIEGPWSRLTSTPTTATNYQDNPAPSGPKLYQIKALKLVVTGSGSYTNSSQGAFRIVN